MPGISFLGPGAYGPEPPQVESPPAAVWRVVSDVRRTGEWSPECRRVVPLGPLRLGTLGIR